MGTEFRPSSTLNLVTANKKQWKKVPWYNSAPQLLSLKMAERWSFTYSHNLISWQYMDIIRRKLMTVTIGTNKLYLFSCWVVRSLLTLSSISRAIESRESYRNNPQKWQIVIFNFEPLQKRNHDKTHNSSVTDPGEAPVPYFSTILRPMGRRNFFLRSPPPLLISGSGWLGPPLSEGLDPPLQLIS